MIFWMYVGSFDDNGVPLPVYSTKSDSPILNSLVGGDGHVTIVRQYADLPFDIDDASSIDIGIAAENCYQAMLDFSVVHALSAGDPLFEHAVFCECSDNDPEYLSIKGKTVLELDFDEIQMLAREKMATTTDQDLLDDFYGYRHIRAHAELVDLIFNAVNRGSSGRSKFRVTSPAKLGLRMLEPPRRSAKQITDAPARGLYEYMFSHELSRLFPETRQMSELRAVERAWHDAEGEIVEFARMSADAGKIEISIDEIVEHLCWDSDVCSAKQAHDAGVPIEDIMV